MSDLVCTDDLVTLLQLSATDAAAQEDVLDRLLEQAEALFLAACNRMGIPFRRAFRDRIEIQEAYAVRRFWLDYPPKAITEIALGPDLSDPTETLDPDDGTVLVWRIGNRMLYRADGHTWRTTRITQPRAGWDLDLSFVRVTYDTQDDVPDDAAAAVLALAQAWYRTLGSEGLQSETLDNYSATFASRTALETAVPGWAQAVAAHKRLIAF